MVCYNADSTIKWISDQKFGRSNGTRWYPFISRFQSRWYFPEVFIHNNIFNSSNGKLLVSGGNNGVGGTGLIRFTVAANLDDNPNDLELAAGYTVYEIEITNPNGTLGNNMIPNNILINGMGRDGQIAIADINNDQQLDVIVETGQIFYSGVYIYTYLNNKYEIISKIEWPYFKSLGVLSAGNVTEKELLIYYCHRMTLLENIHITIRPYYQMIGCIQLKMGQAILDVLCLILMKTAFKRSFLEMKRS